MATATISKPQLNAVRKSLVKEYDVNGIESVVSLRKELTDAALQYFNS